MRRMQTIEKVIGENTFYIRPFGAFAAANISGELAALLSPILAGIAPLFGGLDRRQRLWHRSEPAGYGH